MIFFKKFLVAILCFSFLSITINAKECVNIKELKVKWTSYKTLKKIPVSGTFNKVELFSTQNKPTLQKALLNTKAKIDLKNIDVLNSKKTDNILKYFVTNLKSSNIEAKIIKVNKKIVDVEFIINGTAKVLPMKYKVTENKIVVKGVVDAQDFNLAPALKILNKEVKEHQNKGWFDIPIKFELSYTTTCN